MKLDMRAVPMLASDIGTLCRECSTFHLITPNSRAHEEQPPVVTITAKVPTVGSGNGRRRSLIVTMD